MEFYFDQLKNKYLSLEKDLSPKEINELVNPFILKLSKIPSDIERDLWLKKLGGLIGMIQLEKTRDAVKQLRSMKQKN